jgi:hypothetical protein
MFDFPIIGRPGLASSIQGSHQQGEVAGCRLQQQLFMDVFATSYI